MVQSYRQITPELALRVKLVMADVDGTLTPGGDSVSPLVSQAVRGLEEQGIIVGLVSGRTLPRLDRLARDLDITGPIIAENGGIARLQAGGELIELGYSRRPAIKALQKLKTLFPEAIKEREDNKDRLVDIVIWSDGVAPQELRHHLDDSQLLDSGYILHLMQKGVSKGKTLMRLLDKIGDESLSPEEIIVFGDSSTDMSLFELFPHSVLIPNPKLSAEQTRGLQKVARYASDSAVGDGFAEVAFHIIDACTNEK